MFKKMFALVMTSIVCFACAEPISVDEKLQSKSEEMRFSYRDGRLAKPILLGSAPIYVKEAVNQISQEECGEGLDILKQLLEASGN